MPKTPAHPKLTGGGGFRFEDQVVAFHLAHMLANRPVLGTHVGTIHRLTFQVRPLGWFLDDMLVEFRGGSVRAAAVSIKSNRQITSGGVPENFVGDAWAQFLGEAESSFVEGDDLLVLATSPLGMEVHEDLHELVRWSIHQRHEDVKAHVAQEGVGSAIKRQLFESLRCPAELAGKYSIQEEDTARLIRYLRFLELDFQDEPSEDITRAVEICRTCLTSGELDEARDLWSALCEVASRYRPEAGSIDLRGLLSELGWKFQLRDFPQYAASWTKLRDWCKEITQTIPDKIGGQVRIIREDVTGPLVEELTATPAVVLLAPSGSGKSVIARQFVEEIASVADWLWLEASSATLAPSEIKAQLGLSYPLEEILQGTTSARCYLVVDGVDRLVSFEDFRRLAALIAALGPLEQASPWRLVLVCQSEAWERVQRLLQKASFPIESCNDLVIAPPSYEQLQPVWEAFPALRPLSLRHYLQQILWRPKILDLVATASLRGEQPAVREWVGESSVITWFWQSEVEDAPEPLTRAGTLMELAEMQGDELAFKVPAARFGDRGALDRLVEARVLQAEGTRIGFSHDLYGDWTRLRILLERERDLSDYLPARISSPLWHKAVRLYGVHLLEQKGAEAWWIAFERFAGLADSGVAIQDLLLEALLFAADPSAHFAALWDHLPRNGGQLLRRCLGRFLSVATRPNPMSLAVVSTDDAGARLAAAAQDRLPDWPLWLPLLRFLEARSDDCIRLVPLEVASICECWLRRGSPEWPYRKEATRIALRIANELLDDRFRYATDQGRLTHFAFMAAMAGYDDLPDEVRAFVLRASGRIGKPLHTPDFEQEGRKYLKRRSVIYDDAMEIPAPWPDGPVTRHHDIFAAVCLQGTGLLPIVVSAPELAVEVLLALLIEPPRPRSRHDVPDMIRDRIGVEDHHEWSPAFWWHFPLPSLFHQHPEHAINFVLRLVNFATERWASARTVDGEFVLSTPVLINNNLHTLTGNADVYYWFRDNTRAPRTIASALMALEWYLYSRLDAGEDVSRFLDQILAGMKSVAFAGVLSAVVAKSQDLFAGQLSFLLFEPFFHLWEQEHAVRGESHHQIGWIGHASADVQEAREWHEMPHRKRGIPSWGPWIYLSTPGLAERFEQAKVQWRNTREEALADGAQAFVDHLDRMLALYDRSNWEHVALEDGSSVVQYRHPEDLKQRFAPVAEEAERNFATLAFPLQCRMILDGERSLGEDQLVEFWEALQNLHPLPPETLLNLADARCGGAAVLLLRHLEWLNRHPDRLEWCTHTLIDTLSNPPLVSQFDSDVSVSQEGWAHFCARTIPALWVEHPDLQELRQSIVTLCLDFHYMTVRLLSTAVYSRRGRLGDDYFRFWHLLRAWAVERWRLKEARRVSYLDERPPEETVDQLSAEFVEVAEAFLDGTLSPTLPSLPAPDRVPSAPDRTGYRRKAQRAFPRVDTMLLAYAAAGLPALASLGDLSDRQEVVRAWDEVLGLMVAELVDESVEDSDPADLYMNESDVLHRIATTIGQMRPEEAPERLFTKILGPGQSASTHAESFLRGWFIACLRGQVELTRFRAVWQAMVEYAWQAPRWAASDGRRGHQTREMWRELMGLDGVYRRSWKEEHAAVIASLKPLYQRWADFDLHSGQSAIAFIAFVRTPAGGVLLKDALVWLAAAARRAPRFWTQSGLPDAAARLLADALTDEAGLRRNPPAFESFKDLLGQLCSLQNMIALQIRESLAAS